MSNKEEDLMQKLKDKLASFRRCDGKDGHKFILVKLGRPSPFLELRPEEFQALEEHIEKSVQWAAMGMEELDPATKLIIEILYKFSE